MPSYLGYYFTFIHIFHTKNSPLDPTTHNSNRQKANKQQLLLASFATEKKCIRKGLLSTQHAILIASNKRRKKKEETAVSAVIIYLHSSQASLFCWHIMLCFFLMQSTLIIYFIYFLCTLSTGANPSKP